MGDGLDEELKSENLGRPVRAIAFALLALMGIPVCIMGVYQLATRGRAGPGWMTLLAGMSMTVGCGLIAYATTRRFIVELKEQISREKKEQADCEGRAQDGA